MKLELGSGVSPDPDYDIHLDIDPTHNPDIVADASQPLPFDDNYFDEIKVVDVLEHISYRDTMRVLREWTRILKHGGKIYIQVPEAGEAIRQFTRNKLRRNPDLDPPPINTLAWILLGGHYDGEYATDPDSWRYNAHYALFDKESLQWYLKEVGLEILSWEVNQHPNILCWAIKR